MSRVSVFRFGPGPVEPGLQSLFEGPIVSSLIASSQPQTVPGRPLAFCRVDSGFSGDASLPPSDESEASAATTLDGESAGESTPSSGSAGAGPLPGGSPPHVAMQSTERQANSSRGTGRCTGSCLAGNCGADSITDMWSPPPASSPGPGQRVPNSRSVHPSLQFTMGDGSVRSVRLQCLIRTGQDEHFL